MKGNLISGSAAAVLHGAAGFDDPTEWGRLVRRSENGRLLTFERDFGGGFKVITFVFGA